ncbi:MAG: TlpA family protein disulfide reductase [Clostridia bacterium]|nr:TlpA family protein disulfide reductase [Clostridia bacterium]
MKKIITITLILIVAIATMVALCACEKTHTHVDADSNYVCDECDYELNRPSDDTTTDDGGENGSQDATPTKATYSISLKTIGGKPISGAIVELYADNTFSKVVWPFNTDSNGEASRELTVNDNYCFKIASGLPVGYVADEYYTFTDKHAEVVVSSKVISDTTLPNRYRLGDVMHDFTFTTTDGSSFTLSEELENKDFVLINFWYVTCTFCVHEFPFINSAYLNYSDKVSVIALDTLSSDSAQEVSDFKAQKGLTFDVARANEQYFNVFNGTGYPTSVLVDRYGVICGIFGTFNSQAEVEAIFSYFTADNYVQRTFTSVADFMAKTQN